MQIEVPRFKSSFVLVAANLLPLAGVVWLDWPINDFVFLYWFESIAVGVIAVARLAICIATNDDLSFMSKMAGIFLGTPVFATILGFWCFMYGLFVVAVVFRSTRNPLFDPVVSALVRDPMLLVATAALALSHVFSFVRDFLLAKGYRNFTPGACVAWGGLQILPMLFGFVFLIAPLVMSRSNPAYVIGVFVLIKTYLQYSLPSLSRPSVVERTEHAE